MTIIDILFFKVLENLFVSPERSMVTSPTVSVLRGSNAFYIQDPAYSVNYKAYTDVFEMELWMSVGLAFLILSLLLYIVTQ